MFSTQIYYLELMPEQTDYDFYNNQKLIQQKKNDFFKYKINKKHWQIKLWKSFNTLQSCSKYFETF